MKFVYSEGVNEIRERCFERSKEGLSELMSGKAVLEIENLGL
ncbi:hypothetical protein GEOBRER4_n1845 [Citrifermentans bremense]|uniref:Uncharacterized protein n=1 Tax=Citrifermentans bremense TaxID=60035 RepID=A0A7R7J072_9BACT|nr:hypothetical protein GEOBRER4_n1845 [Citrifermentans bremense]